MTELYVFRHGETDWNAETRIQGWTDIPLNRKGRTQAQGLYERLKGRGVMAMLTSDLSRARETAAIVAAGLAVPVFVDERLREINLGEAEGMLTADVHAKFGPFVVAQWQGTTDSTRDFRFAGGESKREAVTRMRAALREFTARHPGAIVALSTHGGVLRNLAHTCLPDATPKVPIPNCSLHLFHTEPGNENALRYEGVIDAGR